MLAQVVWKGSLSSGALTQLPSEAILTSLDLVHVFLHPSSPFPTVDRFFSYLPSVLTEGCAVLTHPLVPAPQSMF